MSEIGENLKNIVMKGIEVIGNKANILASSAKQKVGEFNLTNEQKDLFCEIGSKVFDLSRQGVEFPGELQADLQKAAEISEELERIHAEKETDQAESDTGKAGKDSCGENTAADSAEDTPAACEYAAEDDRDIPVIEVEEADNDEEKDFADCPLSSAINDLFEKVPPVDKMMDKVNNSLDELGDSLRKFSGEFDRQLDEFTDQMMDKDKKDPQ